MKSKELIKELYTLLEGQKVNLNQLQELPIDTLVWRENSISWNILECVEHLNLYLNYYIPEIKRSFSVKKYHSNGEFKSGWLGAYFVKVIKPKEGSAKMKTKSEMNPLGVELTKNVLHELLKNLIEFQQVLLETLDYDLIKTKTNISISKIIKLRLGDTLRFVVYHNERHFKQIDEICKKYMQSEISA